MNKITFEDYPSTNTPINSTNLNQIQTNTEDAITSLSNSTTASITALENKFNYSSSELEIGKWVNNETLYRKVVNTGAISQADKSVAHGISNLDKVVKIDGIAVSGSNYYMIPRITHGSVQDFVGVRVGSTNVEIICGSSPGFSDSWVILEYTKSA